MASIDKPTDEHMDTSKIVLAPVDLGHAGVRAFFDFESNFSKKMATQVAAEFNNKNDSAPPIHPTFVHSLRRVLANKVNGVRLGDTLPRVNLFFFLASCALSTPFPEKKAHVRYMVKNVVEFSAQFPGWMVPGNPRVLEGILSNRSAGQDYGNHKKFMDSLKEEALFMRFGLFSASIKFKKPLKDLITDADGLGTDASMANCRKKLVESPSQDNKLSYFNCLLFLGFDTPMAETKICLELDKLYKAVLNKEKKRVMLSKNTA